MCAHPRRVKASAEGCFPLMRDETVASTLTFALHARGPQAGAWSKAVESVGGTSNGIVGSTANGIRSHSTHAEGGDHPHGPLQLRLTEDQAAAAGAAPVEARDDARGQATPGRQRWAREGSSSPRLPWRLRHPRRVSTHKDGGLLPSGIASSHSSLPQPRLRTAVHDKKVEDSALSRKSAPRPPSAGRDGFVQLRVEAPSGRPAPAGGTRRAGWRYAARGL